MKPNYLTTILVIIAVSLLPAQSYAGKKPTSASDVVCVECVDTTDIADSAVTSEKLSSDLQVKIYHADMHLAPVITDGNGDVIGTLLELPSGGSSAYVINGNGFLFRVHHFGYIQDKSILYDNQACTGNPQYLGASNTMVVESSSAIRGEIVVSDNPEVPPAIYYVPRDAEQESLSVYYRAQPDGLSCTLVANKAYRLIPNDPSITGVFTDTFPLPLSIDRP